MKPNLIFGKIPDGDEAECYSCSDKAAYQIRVFPGSYIEPEEWVDLCERCFGKGELA